MRATDDAAMFVTSAVAIIRDARAPLRPVAVSWFSATDRRSDSREECGVLQRHHLVGCCGFLGKDFRCDELSILALEIHIGNPTGHRALPSDEDRHSLSDHCCQHVL